MLNYVMLTALNHYDPAVYGKADLKMCVGDADMFENLISDDWMRIRMFDADCRRAEILSNLEWVASRILPGERFYWFHSGHGTYADRGRSRATGRCMYDGVLWDSEVANALSKFPEGVVVMTLSDTCYSESNSRNALHPLLNDYCTKKTMGKSLINSKVLESLPTSVSSVKYKAAVIHLSACTANQLSWETKQGGVFTQCVKKALEQQPDITIGKLLGVLVAMLKGPEYIMFNQKPIMYTNQLGKSKKPLVFSVK